MESSEDEIQTSICENSQEFRESSSLKNDDESKVEVKFVDTPAQKNSSDDKRELSRLIVIKEGKKYTYRPESWIIVLKENGNTGVGRLTPYYKPSTGEATIGWGWVPSECPAPYPGQFHHEKMIIRTNFLTAEKPSSFIRPCQVEEKRTIKNFDSWIAKKDRFFYEWEWDYFKKRWRSSEHEPIRPNCEREPLFSPPSPVPSSPSLPLPLPSPSSVLRSPKSPAKRKSPLKSPRRRLKKKVTQESVEPLILESDTPTSFAQEVKETEGKQKEENNEKEEKEEKEDEKEEKEEKDKTGPKRVKRENGVKETMQREEKEKEEEEKGKGEEDTNEKGKEVLSADGQKKKENDTHERQNGSVNGTVPLQIIDLTSSQEDLPIPNTPSTLTSPSPSFAMESEEYVEDSQETFRTPSPFRTSFQKAHLSNGNKEENLMKEQSEEEMSEEIIEDTPISQEELLENIPKSTDEEMKEREETKGETCARDLTQEERSALLSKQTDPKGEKEKKRQNEKVEKGAKKKLRKKSEEVEDSDEWEVNSDNPTPPQRKALFGRLKNRMRTEQCERKGEEESESASESAPEIRSMYQQLITKLHPNTPLKGIDRDSQKTEPFGDVDWETPIPLGETMEEKSEETSMDVTVNLGESEDFSWDESVEPKEMENSKGESDMEGEEEDKEEEKEREEENNEEMGEGKEREEEEGSEEEEEEEKEEGEIEDEEKEQQRTEEKKREEAEEKEEGEIEDEEEEEQQKRTEEKKREEEKEEEKKKKEKEKINSPNKRKSEDPKKSPQKKMKTSQHNLSDEEFVYTSDGSDVKSPNSIIPPLPRNIRRNLEESEDTELDSCVETGKVSDPIKATPVHPLGCLPNKETPPPSAPPPFEETTENENEEIEESQPLVPDIPKNSLREVGTPNSSVLSNDEEPTQSTSSPKRIYRPINPFIYLSVAEENNIEIVPVSDDEDYVQDVVAHLNGHAPSIPNTFSPEGDIAEDEDYLQDVARNLNEDAPSLPNSPELDYLPMSPPEDPNPYEEETAVERDLPKETAEQRNETGWEKNTSERSVWEGGNTRNSDWGKNATEGSEGKGWGNSNTGSGWGTKNRESSGWGNDSSGSGWGTKNAERGGWGNSNTGTWGTKNRESSGWNSNSGSGWGTWGTKNAERGGWGNSNTGTWGTRNSENSGWKKNSTEGSGSERSNNDWGKNNTGSSDRRKSSAEESGWEKSSTSNSEGKSATDERKEKTREEPEEKGGKSPTLRRSNPPNFVNSPQQSPSDSPSSVERERKVQEANGKTSPQNNESESPFAAPRSSKYQFPFSFQNEPLGRLHLPSLPLHLPANTDLNISESVSLRYHPFRDYRFQVEISSPEQVTEFLRLVEVAKQRKQYFQIHLTDSYLLRLRPSKENSNELVGHIVRYLIEDRNRMPLKNDIL